MNGVSSLIFWGHFDRPSREHRKRWPKGHILRKKLQTICNIFIILSTVRTQPHSNAKRFIKSCRKRLQHVPRVGAEKDNYQQKGPVKTKKLTVGNFYIFHTLAVIALSFLKLLIKIKWKNIKKFLSENFKIKVFGTELDCRWRLKLSLLRRILKIVSPCRAFCIVLFSICVINRWGDAVHLLKSI